MNSPSDHLAELQALCEAAIEGRLTPEQRQRLEQLVFADPQARRFYVEYLHQHACLQWSAAEPSAVSRPNEADVLSLRRVAVRRRRVVAAALAAACLLLALGAWLVFRPGSGSVATLADGKACKWESGTLPTEAGARLGRGRLRLAGGWPALSSTMAPRSRSKGRPIWRSSRRSAASCTVDG